MSSSTVSFPTTLVLGGARSGKSGFAETLVRRQRTASVYLATATAGDEEMEDRIGRHREDRGTYWITVEEPLDLVGALLREASPNRIVLVDCLTLWLSNLIFAERDPAIEVAALTRALHALPGPAVLVSNEIGLGLVPDTALGRAFRDAHGRMNQSVAYAVPRVAFIAAGLPLWLKGRSEEAVP